MLGGWVGGWLGGWEGSIGVHEGAGDSAGPKALLLARGGLGGRGAETTASPRSEALVQLLEGQELLRRLDEERAFEDEAEALALIYYLTEEGLL